MTYRLPIVKRYFLAQNKVPEDIINRIENDKDADELIENIQAKLIENQKNNDSSTQDQKDQKDQKKENMKNIQGSDFQLPPPEEVESETKPTFSDRLKNLRVNNAIDCRWNKNARIARIYTDEYPEGRVF